MNNREIDRVYYINLSDRQDKHWVQRATLGMRGFPFSIVDRFEAVDGRSYKTFDSIIQAIIDDGFPTYKIFFDKPPPDAHDPARIKNVAGEWSHLRCLRQIVERDEITLVLEDDTCIDSWMNSLNRILKTINDLQILYLEFWFHKCETDLESLLMPAIIEKVYYGFHGSGSRARLFTPKGAKQFLQLTLDNPWHNSEMQVYEAWRRSVILDGIYVCIPLRTTHLAQGTFDSDSDVWTASQLTKRRDKRSNHFF